MFQLGGQSNTQNDNRYQEINYFINLTIEESRKLNYVLAVGGANVEYVYQQNDNAEFLIKQSFNEKEVEYGGSGLNYTLRLLSSGVDTFSILPLGNDDEGKHILQKMMEAQKRGGLNTFKFEELDLLIDNIRTIESLIISDRSGRTIWSNENKYLDNITFNNIIQNKLDFLSQLKTNPKVIMIGHIHSDRVNDGLQLEELATKKLIDSFYNKSLIYVNLGRSQLEYGFKFWRETLKKVDIMQFNLEEVKYFFEKDKGENLPLNNIISEMRKLNINFIITLDKLGALCVSKDDDKIIYASEINIIDDYKDKTGAGDAFASGVIYDLLEHNEYKNIGFHQLMRAIEVGRTWATYACTSLGSASNCPKKHDIKNYHKKLFPIPKSKQIDIVHESIIDLIDKAYMKCI